jgi:hypothetical protein
MSAPPNASGHVKVSPTNTTPKTMASATLKLVDRGDLGDRPSWSAR